MWRVVDQGGKMDTEAYRKLQDASVSTLIWKLINLPDSSHWSIKFVFEFCLFVIPQIVIFALPRYSWNLLPWMASILALGLLLRGPRVNKPVSTDQIAKEPRKSAITNFRAGMMIQTIIGILAVDFSSFPRRHAKTEMFGTSLMDVGIGCMIFSSGMVSASHYSSNKGKSLKTAFRSGLPMLVLGLVRVVVIKLLGYQEHVSEYGMYWNFFITIALLPILSSLVSKLFDVKHFAVVALAISCLYEIALKKTRLEQYLLGDYRIDLISMNKEGIFSLIGCTCLFLASCWVGENARHVRDTKSYRQFVKKMALSSIISTSAYLLGHHLFDLESSRRLANLGFNLWVFGFCTLHIVFFLIGDLLLPRPSQFNTLFEAVNQNQLAMFLLANLLTGLVNMTWQTLLLGEKETFLILVSYCAVLFFVASLLRKLNITIKFK